MSSEVFFTGKQAATVQTALRAELGLPPEQFPAQAFVGMISDEIEQLRAAGMDDERIAGLVSEAAGTPIAGETITRYYAPPESRGHGQVS